MSIFKKHAAKELKLYTLGETFVQLNLPLEEKFNLILEANNDKQIVSTTREYCEISCFKHLLHRPVLLVEKNEDIYDIHIQKYSNSVH